jgi:hypothetical protein
VSGPDAKREAEADEVVVEMQFHFQRLAELVEGNPVAMRSLRSLVNCIARLRVCGVEEA